MLIRNIQQRIAGEGPISFRDFMEMALYYPGLGYYTSGKERTGRRGDYYTSPELTFLYGMMMAMQIEEMFHRLNDGPFTIVEYGTGSGFLCADILHHLQSNKSLYDNLRYCVIERGLITDREKKRLPAGVTFYDSIRDIPDLSGCVLSNELPDNFPVHVVVMQDELMEVFVDYKNGFTEVLRPAQRELRAYFAELGVKLPMGFRTEVNLDAIAWISEIATCLQRGFVMTVDYGFPSSELYSERRRNGTLLCYKNHWVNDDPYTNVGEKDITTHVNFSALSHFGARHGLEFGGFTDMAHFLRAWGVENYLIQPERQQGNNIPQISGQSLLYYILMKDMGPKFKVLIQTKHVPEVELTGIKLTSGQ